VPDRRTASVEISSVVTASPEQVWARAATLEGVNDELFPVLRMTAPRGLRLDAADVPLGRVWLRSRLLLGGRIPVGRSDLTLLRVDATGFLERSPMTGMALWEHERTLEPHAGGCLVRDRLRARTRVPLPAALVGLVVGTLFRHRHRRLAAAFSPPG
jgi:hypothetical protein